MALPGPFLFYRPGGLGDCLAAWPAMRLVRGAYPGRAALLAAAVAPARLAVRAGLADGIVAIDDPVLAGLFASSAGTGSTLRLPGAAPVSLWAWLLREPPPEFRESAARVFGDELRISVYDPAAGLSIGRFFFARAAGVLGLEASAAAYESAARLPDPGPPPFSLPDRPFAVLHPGSGSPRKNAPPGVFTAAAESLAERGLSGFLVTGPAEAGRPENLRELRIPAGWRLLREPPLEDLAGLLARCAAYIGNDSGITHLAAAAGAPVLAFFRDENLPAWLPCGRTALLAVPEPGAISAADVRTALTRFPAPSALQYRL
jgi:heptosyltransferase III